MFRTRLISGIFLVVIALAVIIAGGPVLGCALLFCAVVGMQELYRAAGVVSAGSGASGVFNLLNGAAFLGIAVYYVLLMTRQNTYLPMCVILSLMLILAVYVLTFPRFHADQAMAAFFGLVYVGVMLGFIYLTRMGENGRIIVWLIFLSSWGADTCAYVTGMTLGKHKMAPVLSPKKSVEGAVGGVAGAALLGVIYAFAVNGGNSVPQFALICAAGAVISMIGDLAASAIKRDKDINDYGTLIPGHGGILDRFDSVIFTAPVIYFLHLLLVTAPVR